MLGVAALGTLRTTGLEKCSTGMNAEVVYSVCAYKHVFMGEQQPTFVENL